jgi:hypothetical protein
MLIAERYPSSQRRRIWIFLFFIHVRCKYLVPVLSLTLVFVMEDRNIGSGQSNYERLAANDGVLLLLATWGGDCIGVC